MDQLACLLAAQDKTTRFNLPHSGISMTWRNGEILELMFCSCPTFPCYLVRRQRVLHNVSTQLLFDNVWIKWNMYILRT